MDPRGRRRTRSGPVLLGGVEQMGIHDPDRTGELPELSDGQPRQIQRRQLHRIRRNTARPARPARTLRPGAGIRHGSENHRRTTGADPRGSRQGHSHLHLRRDQPGERHLQPGQPHRGRTFGLHRQRQQTELPQHGTLRPPAYRCEALLRHTGRRSRRERFGRTLPPGRRPLVQNRRGL